MWQSDAAKREKMENLNLLLLGALRAERMVGLKMNIPEQQLKDIIALLPSLLAPTIASLYETDWYSVEVVVNQGEVRTLIPRLIRAGAQGIVEYPLHKVISSSRVSENESMARASRPGIGDRRPHKRQGL